MTISYNWLKEYIEIKETPEALGDILTSTGLEVENIETFESLRGGLNGLVVGEVLSCAKHPNADKLSVTKVDIGTGQPVQIVCGAPNVSAGLKVIVAVPGATIYPKQGDPIVIKKAKIRGEQSEGMICAEDEIGIGDTHEGIMILDSTAPIGMMAADYFNINPDRIFQIGLTPNRADAASHIGVARDIRASTSRSLRMPSLTGFSVDNQSLTIPVEVENTEACPRYCGLTFSGITVQASPDWLKDRLLSIGLSPINNVVDITNFVCHELGQPLHAFDADEITGGMVIVKTLPSGSKFTTLDGKDRTLLDTDLMICNTHDPMCIAGVFGGIRSGISAGTKNMFLESAYFSPTYVRRTAQHHQLRTDASFRFERGTDPNMTVFALKRAAMLIKEVAGGKITSEIVDVYPSKIVPRQIQVKDKNVNRLIGKVIPRKEIFSILERLDIEVVNFADDHYTVSVPPYRVDIMEEADIVEEILRIYGFNNIELTASTRTDFLATFPANDIDKYKQALAALLNGNGYFEIWTNSLTNQGYQQKFELSFAGNPVEIINKLSDEQGILRQTLLFTGLEVCAYNLNRKQRDLKLFEFGKIYYQLDGHYHEEERLALFLTGDIETENWQHQTQAVAFHDLAQQVSNVIARSGGGAVEQEMITDQLFDYGLTLKMSGGEIAKLGKVKNALLRHFGIKEDLFYAELKTTLLFRNANPKFVIQDVPKFPEVRRDVSLVLDRRVTFDEIKDLVHATEKSLIKSIIVFDVYEGKNIPKDKKAYAMGFTLLDEHKTLTDQEIEKTMDRLMLAFEQKLGAIIRK
jgi:phenylalanyl-tRNA synthetase beta chain